MPRGSFSLRNVCSYSGSRLQVVDPFHVGDVRPKAGVRQSSVLADRFRLKIRSKIGKRIRAGIVVVVVAAHERAEREHRTLD